MLSRSIDPASAAGGVSVETTADVDAVMARSDALVGIEDVQKSLNRSRASVYRYTNTDPRNLNPPFNPRKLNPAAARIAVETPRVETTIIVGKTLGRR